MPKRPPDLIIADDIVSFPDLLPYDNEMLESIIFTGLIGTSLMPMPYHEGHLYDAIGYDFDQVPVTNQRMHGDRTWPERQYGGTQRAQPRALSPRQKVLKARALNKANRKRARK